MAEVLTLEEWISQVKRDLQARGKSLDPAVVNAIRARETAMRAMLEPLDLSPTLDSAPDVALVTVTCPAWMWRDVRAVTRSEVRELIGDHKE